VSTHIFPDGEADRHFPCAGCHCDPWERAVTDAEGSTTWAWCHEVLGERRRRRLTDRRVE